MYKKNTNTASARSQQLMAQAMLDIMCGGKPYHNITITEIADKAKFVRKTFYRNFETKDDVVVYLFEKIFKTFKDKYIFKKENLKEILTDIFAYTRRYREYLLVLYKYNLFSYAYSNENYATISENLFNIIDKDVVSEIYYKYIPAQIISIIIATIEIWINDNFRNEPEELGELTEQVILGKIYK